MYNQHYCFILRGILQGDEKLAIQPDYNKVYESNNYGPYKIIRQEERVKSRKMVLIEFLNTGYRKIVREDAAVVGAVKDDIFGIDFTKVYHSNLYGPFVILQYVGRNKDKRRLVLIKFLNTGHEKIITHKAAMLGYAVDDGALLDPATPDMFDDPNKYLDRLLKGIWKCMIGRCYNKNDAQYAYYGGIGVTVCDEWKDRDVFLQTVSKVRQFDKYCRNPYNYQLDKDYLQLNVPKHLRVYSKETCIFLSNQDNKNLSIIERGIGSDRMFYGVTPEDCGTFRVEMHVKGEYKNIGTFTNPIAAANAFNYFQEMYHEYELVPLLNNVPYMPPHEFFKYKIGTKSMVRIVK